MTGTNSEIVLEIKCSVCGGVGRIATETNIKGLWWTCSTCNGSGYEATELGEKILSLIRNNLAVISSASE